MWDFFSRPQNLNDMTPNDLKFKITTKNLPQRTYQGQIITYTIELFPMISNYWVTEITLVKPNQLFIDEQRFGPYKMWHHEHHFQELTDGSVEMIDRITYKLPFGFLGRLLASTLIKKRLKAIFEYRYQYCERVFGR